MRAYYQRHREPQLADRQSHGQGGSLAELRAEASLAGDGDPGHRTSPSKGGGLPPASTPSGGVEVVVEPEEQGRGINDDPEPIGISTRKGIDPSKKPLRANESLKDRVTTDLTAIKIDKSLVRSFFMAESVGYTIY